MMLEAQFGADNVNPVAEPKLPPMEDDDEEEGGQEKEKDASGPTAKQEGEEDTPMQDAAPTSETGNDEAKEQRRREKLERRRRAELDRLHKLGIPVPGIRIKVDKMEATVWLEDLEIECSHKAFADRVSRVCERAAEVTAPLWG